LKTVLFTFEDDAARDQFLAAVQGAATAKFDPPIKEDHERQCSLWVSGEKLIEGNLSDMQKRFQQECSSHSASVVLKEYRGGEWHDIRARRLQPS
jgi:hypothetical protein